MENEPEDYCVSCYEKKPASQVATVPCEHQYCGECLDSLFTSAANYQTPYPPRCCHAHIGLAEYRYYLSVEVIMLCVAREHRNHTRRDGGYCHDPKCAAMIPPTSLRENIGDCPKCGLETCLVCMEAAHEGPCAQDAPIQRVLDLGKKSGWQRCQSCGDLIELREGCRHMTCNCGFEFCYICGEGVMSCKCNSASRLDDVRNEHLRRRFGVDVVALSNDEFQALMTQYLEEEREQEMITLMLDRQREDEDGDEDKREEDEEDDEDKKEEDEDVDDEWLRNYFRSSVVRRSSRGRTPPNPPRSLSDCGPRG
ncbi:hypothetical protein BJ166DRAFT_101294 [Pestalotiopsis sp. NC0098]|nr:hypothetical protein BJ166DRAFT_101294 [Pestalotiopsis sp. NC0098]